MVWRLLKKKHNKFDAISESSSFSEAEISVDGYNSGAKGQVAVEAKATTAAVKHRRVSFADVEVRHYRLIVGDNPYTEVPLSLGWEYDDSRHATLDEFEAHHSAGDYKNAQLMEPLEVAERQARLRRAGYTNDQIRREERRRRVLLLLEWTYRHNREENAIYTCPHGPIMFKRYIM